MMSAGGNPYKSVATLFAQLAICLVLAGVITGMIVGYIAGGIISDGSDGLEAELALGGMVGAGLGGLISAGVITLFWFLNRRSHHFKIIPAALCSATAGVAAIIGTAYYIHNLSYVDPDVTSLKASLAFSVFGAAIVSIFEKFKSKKGGCDVYIN